ncbi:hypothetical protein MASR1M45_12630 [Candidatus Kapaibacterium sp.]
MKVTFQKKNLRMTLNCNLMSIVEEGKTQRIDFNTSDTGMVSEFYDEIKRVDKIIIDNDVAVKVNKTKIEQHEDYFIIRINYN